MNLTAETLPLWLNLLSTVFVLWVLVMALRFIPFGDLKNDTGLQHRLGFSVLMLAAIWSMRAGVTDGLGLHFFLITTLHVVFGWQYAIWVVALVQMGLVAFGVESLWAFGMNAVTSGVIPILVTYICWRYIERKQLFNPFAFIFGVGFAGAIISVLASAFFVSVTFLLTKTYSLFEIQYELWAYLPLIALPEGIINGMLIAGLIVFKPEWVLLFDEKKYYQ